MSNNQKPSWLVNNNGSPVIQYAKLLSELIKDEQFKTVVEVLNKKMEKFPTLAGFLLEEQGKEMEKKLGKEWQNKKDALFKPLESSINIKINDLWKKHNLGINALDVKKSIKSMIAGMVHDKDVVGWKGFVENLNSRVESANKATVKG